eukprot:m.11366 g.11366  ORF g.11366 m.11366 type:complete len:73 (+) comp6885_c0_seq1:61-279(+)
MDGQLHSYHKKIPTIVDTVDDEWAKDKLPVDMIKIPPEFEVQPEMSPEEAEEQANENKWIEIGVHGRTADNQ